MTPSELEQTLCRAATKVVSVDEARYFAKELVEAYIRKSPRTNPLQEAVMDVKTTLKYQNEAIRYVTDLPAFISIDFQRHGPLVYLKRIHDELEQRSTQNGIAMAAFTNSRCMHTLHTWVQGLAKRGLVAIAIQNGGPSTVVPFNGTKGVFGTNPMAYGIPDSNGEINCVDMATSQIPYFDILNSNKDKTPLPDHAAVDDKGEFTTEASKALDFSHSQSDPIGNIVSIGGGYKGYYLTYLMEILTSGLIGTLASTQQSSDFVAEEHGAVLIVFNPKAMGTAKQLQTSITSLHDVVKNQKPKKGTSIRLPGEANSRRYVELKDKKIKLKSELLEELDSLV